MPSIKEVAEELTFARKVMADFAANPEHTTFGEVTAGGLLAIRWGITGTAVKVVKLDEYHRPTVYST
jgi:hypothetical protein